MSKKKNNTFKKILSILACVALLAVTVIPVNNIYAEDNGNSTNTSQEVDNSNTNTTTDTQNTSSDSSNQLQETPSQENTNNTEETPISNQENQGSTQDNNNNRPALKAPPTRNGGVSITASIVDENGDTIDFSSGTAGNQETATIQHYRESNMFSYKYDVSAEVNGLDINKTYTVEVDIDNYLYVNSYGIDTTGTVDSRMSIYLDTTKGENNTGITFVKNPSLVNNANLKESGHITYYLIKGAEGFPLFFNISSTGVLHFEELKDAIKIEVKEVDTGDVVQQTSLERIIPTAYGSVPGERTFSFERLLDDDSPVTDVTTLYRPAYSFPTGGYTDQMTFSDLELTITIDKPAAKLKQINNNFIVDDSRKEEGIYVIKRNNLPRTEDVNYQHHLPYIDIYASSGDFNDGDVVNVRIDYRVRTFDPHAADGLGKEFTSTYYNKVTFKQETGKLSITDKTGDNVWVSEVSETNGYLGYFSLNNYRVFEDKEYIFDINFDTSSIGVQGFLVLNLNHEYTFTYTTVNDTDPKTVTITSGNRYSQRPIHTNNYEMTLVSYKDLGINEDDYIKSIKYVETVKKNKNYGLSYFGVVLDDDGVPVNTIEAYDVDGEPGDSSSSGVKKSSFPVKKAAGDWMNVIPTYTIYSGSSQEIEFVGRYANQVSQLNAPYYYFLVTTKDENNEYLRLSQIKYNIHYILNNGTDISNEQLKQSAKDVPASAITEKVVDGLGRVYRIDSKLLEFADVRYGTFMTRSDGSIVAVSPDKSFYITLQTTPGTPDQSQKYSDMFFVEDRYFDNSVKTITDYWADPDYPSLMQPGAPDGLQDPDRKGYAIYHMNENSNDGYSIVSAPNYNVYTSAKHKSASEYLPWNEGDEPIAVGNKSRFEIKVDVVNTSEKEIVGPSYIYVPIPKVAENDADKFKWGSLLYTNSQGEMQDLKFDVNLLDVSPAGRTTSLSSSQFSIEYGKIEPTDGGNDLNGYAWSSSMVSGTNCVRIMVQNLRANTAGTPDVYSFILECEMDKNTSEEGLVDIIRPRYFKTIEGQPGVWDYGSYLALETALGEVRGQLFYDADMNGKFDSNENSLPKEGVELTLLDANNAEISKTWTDSNGEYLFVDIKTKEEYYIVADNPDASLYAFTTLGTPNNKTTGYNTDNQFDENGKSTTVYPAMAGTNGLTSATYNVGLRDANAKSKVTFDANGGKVADQDKLVLEELIGTTVNKPADPVRDGYKFKHWYLDGDTSEAKATIVDKHGIKDVTYKAKWEADNYTVIFDTDGGTAVDNKTVNYTDGNLTSGVTTAKDGYTFDGWLIATGAKYNNETFDVLAGSPSVKEVTLKANWEAKTYTVYFVDDGNTLAEKNDVTWNQDKLAENVDDPTKTGYKFNSWLLPDGRKYNDEAYNKLVNNDTVTSLTLTAKWEEKTFTVTYNTAGGTPAIEPKTVKWTDTGLLNGVPVRKGYELTGWSYNNTDSYGKSYAQLVGNDDTVRSIELVAQWDPIDYTVEFDTDGGSPVNDITVTFDQDNLTDGIETTKKGFNLVGWFIDKVKEIIYGENGIESYADVVNNNDKKYSATLYAKWENKMNYTVKYQDKDGNELKPDKTVSFIDTNLKPGNDPEKTGHVFKGWFMDKEFTKDYNNDAYSVLVGDDDTKGIAILYGKFDPITFTVEFDSNGGEGYMAPKEVTYGDQTADGKAPDVLFTKDGYEPDGWNSAPDGSGTPYAAGSDISTLADKDGKTVKLYTQWKATEYTISYDLDGGSVQGTNPVIYTIESEDITLINPTRKGYEFTGWTGTDLTDKTMTVTIEKGSKGNREYKANWEIIEYTISYDLDGGQLPDGKQNPVSYTVETEDFTLENPVKTGYNFVGWTGTDLSDKTMTVTVSKDSTGNREYKANWEAITYTISFSDEGADSGEAPADMEATYDTPVTAPGPNTLVSAGKDFDGWLDKETGKVYKEGDDILNLTSDDGETITLVPNWVEFSYYVHSGMNQIWTKGTGSPAEFVFKRSRADEKTHELFKAVYVDGAELPAANYSATKGSLRLNLNTSYLESLSTGSHTLRVVFEDGEVSTTFGIRNRASSSNNNRTSPNVTYQIPRTGIGD